MVAVLRYLLYFLCILLRFRDVTTGHSKVISSKLLISVLLRFFCLTVFIWWHRQTFSAVEKWFCRHCYFQIYIQILMQFEGGMSFIIPDDMLCGLAWFIKNHVLLRRSIFYFFLLFFWIDSDCFFFFPQPSIVVYRLWGPSTVVYSKETQNFSLCMNF